MTVRSSMIRLSGTVALAVVLVAPAYSIAHADDEYSTGHETTIRGAASAASAEHRPRRRAEHDREAMTREPAASNKAGRVSSTVPMADSKADVVGAGGAQDQLGREIHHSGTGTDW